ncbi:MAG: dephospho-CoA kinase [Bacillota bacterium]
MLVIGLTGGIASGKSTLSSILQQLGAHIIDADAVAHEVVRPGTPAHRELVEAFGRDILNPDSTINRRRLGRLVFSDREALHRLNNITHPRVISAIAGELDALRRQGTGVVVVDAPLLIEAGMTGLVDEVWVVAVDESTQLERLMSRDRYSFREAMNRLGAQLPLREKVRHAHRVINNSGTVEETRRQVEVIWEKLRLGENSRPRQEEI